MCTKLALKHTYTPKKKRKKKKKRAKRDGHNDIKRVRGTNKQYNTKEKKKKKKKIGESLIE